MNFTDAYTITNVSYLLTGLFVTLKVAFFSILLSFAIGVVLGILRYSKLAGLSQLATFYIETIRNTPLLLIIFFTYFALPEIGIKLGATIAAIAALTVFTSSLIAEIVRGGITSIDKGQMEAARSQGFTYIQAMRYIILPQALKRMIPPLVSQFISLIKDTSLAMIISLEELTRTGQIIYSQNVTFVLPILLLVAFLYFLINFSLSRLSRLLENRLTHS